MRSIHYKDKWIRIIGSLLFSYVIDAMGRPESLFERMTFSHFYIDLLSGFVMTIAVWQIVRRGIIYLDKRYDWFSQTLRRLPLQMLLGVVAPSLLSFLLTYVYMRLAWQQDLFKTEWLYNEFFTIVLFILFINFLYFTLWVMNQKKEEVQSIAKQAAEALYSTQQKANKPSTVEVTKGEKIILLPVSGILYAYLKDGYCYIRSEADAFLTTYVLDDLQELLPEEDFFRANRQIIINRKSCKAYASIENGKIKVELEPAYKQDCIVSQKRAKYFREWINKEKRQQSASV